MVPNRSTITPVSDLLVWIDCEMTGLDLEADALIEIAVLVTDGDLNVKGEGLELVITPPDGALEQMTEFVKEMHVKSGLLDDLTSGKGISMEEAEQTCLDYIKQYVPVERKAPLAGNTVGTDRAFLARDMPILEAYLHYRNVDVSSIKELAVRWFPKAYYQAPAKNGNHRALADIQESIEELRYYREAIFVPSPGPTTEEARKISRKHQGALTGITPDASEESSKA